MYPYHNKIKQRIKNGELSGYYYAMNYPNIGQCLVLVFQTHPNLRPIRPHKYEEYTALLEMYSIKTQSDGQNMKQPCDESH